jgi:hypothetical protein
LFFGDPELKISIEKIRRALALVMVACMFLPLAQCTPKPDPSVHTAPPAPSRFIAADEAMAQFKRSGELTLAAVFLWPLPALLVLALVRRRGVRIAVHLLELAACAWAMYGLWIIIAFNGEIRYGGVIFCGTLLLYFGFTAYCLVWQIRRNRLC